MLDFALPLLNNETFIRAGKQKIIVSLKKMKEKSYIEPCLKPYKC